MRNVHSFCKHSEKSSSTLAVCKWSARVFLWSDGLSFRNHRTKQSFRSCHSDQFWNWFLVCFCSMNIFLQQPISVNFHKNLKNVSFLQINSNPHMALNCLAKHGRSSLICLQIWEEGFEYGSQQQKPAEQWKTSLSFTEGRTWHPLQVQLTVYPLTLLTNAV